MISINKEVEKLRDVRLLLKMADEGWVNFKVTDVEHLELIRKAGSIIDSLEHELVRKKNHQAWEKGEIV